MRPMSDRDRAERAMVEFALAQHDVVSATQLAALGFDKFAVQRRVRAGRLAPVHRGVYVVGRPAPGPKGRAMAATLAARGSAAGCRSAGAVLGVRPYAGTPEVLVCSRAGRHPRADLIIHRTTSLHPDDITVIEGIPVTTFARTALDLAATIRDGLDRVLIRGEELELFDLVKIEAAIARAPRHRGIGPLRAALARLHPDVVLTDSELEIAMLALCQAHALPVPSVSRMVEGKEVDFLWPDHRLVVETDGWGTHRTRHAFQDDRTRDRILQLAGYRVLRFTHADVVYRAEVVSGQLRRALRAQ